MKLKTYMQRYKISVSMMARAAGITERSVYLYRAESRIPSGSTIKRIVAATNGKVKAEDLL